MTELQKSGEFWAVSLLRFDQLLGCFFQNLARAFPIWFLERRDVPTGYLTVCEVEAVAHRNR